MNVLLARWLGADEYGAFTVGFGAMTFLAAIHVGLLTEPMGVFGPGRYRERFHAYMGAVVWGHALFAIPAVLVLVGAGGVAWAVGSRALWVALAGFGVACPVVLLLWLLRRASYIRSEPWHAAIAGAAYAIVMVPGLALLQHAGRLSIGAAVSVTGIASLLAVTWLLVAFKPDVRAVDRAFFREVVTEHARFGRWGVGTGVLYFATGQLFYLLLPLHGGLDEAGALRALVTLTTPMALVSTACAAVLGPALVRARGTPESGRRLRTALIAVLVVAVAYGLFVGLFHRWLLDVAYGGRYSEYGRWLWVLGLAIPAAAAAELLQAALRAVERPQRVFRAYAISAGVAMVIGGGVIITFGLPGAAVAVALSAWTAAGVLCWGYARSVGTSPEGT